MRSALALALALALVGIGAARASTGGAPEAERAAGAPAAGRAAGASEAERAAGAPEAGRAAGAPEAAAEPAATVEPEVPHLEGPRRVDLGEQIEIDLPAGFTLYERAQARELLQKSGSNAANVLALVGRSDKNWVVIISYDDVGYVTDSDADELDSGDLLESYRRGTAEQNARRRQLGLAELTIDGWSDPPRYDRVRRQLVWGIDGHTAEGPVINHFTNVLGRGGYLSMDLIDEPATLEWAKMEAAPILAATRFKPGARYEDYREGDRSSGFGLRTLVLGGVGVAVAKKTGILVAILLGLKKGLVVILAGIAGLFKWLFGRGRRRSESTPDEAVATEPAPAEGPPDSPPDSPPAA